MHGIPITGSRKPRRRFFAALGLAALLGPELHAATPAVDFVVGVNGQRYVVEMTAPAAIAEARDILGGRKPQRIVAGRVAFGHGGFNRDPGTGLPWNWHLLPDTVVFTDTSAEISDGRPSDVEADPPVWVNKVRYYGSWIGRIEAERTGPPEMIRQPVDRIAAEHTVATFDVSVIGSPSPACQWQESDDGVGWTPLVDGDGIVGARSPVLSVTARPARADHRFRCVATNASGTATSASATLSIAPLVPVRFLALSVRAQVGTGNNVLIPGVAVTGAAPKPLVIRALGPELQRFGVARPLADPQIALRTLAGQLLASNDDWDFAEPAFRTAFRQVGLGDLPDGSKDSALLATLPPGLYTPIIAGAASGTGVALVEFYDLDPAHGTLGAISTRARVGTGSDVLIPGVVIGGTVPMKTLVRVSGPALLALGVTDALRDPACEVKDVNGVTIQLNNNWSDDDADLRAATAAVGATPFPAASKDAALLLDLPPGLYTIVVRGVGDTTGVALVELFAVP